MDPTNAFPYIHPLQITKSTPPETVGPQTFTSVGSPNKKLKLEIKMKTRSFEEKSKIIPTVEIITKVKFLHMLGLTQKKSLLPKTEIKSQDCQKLSDRSQKLLRRCRPFSILINRLQENQHSHLGTRKPCREDEIANPKENIPSTFTRITTGQRTRKNPIKRSWAKKRKSL